MKENQIDNSNQETDRKSHQEQTQDGKRKEEINPNIPKANQGNQQGPPEGKKQTQDLPAAKIKTNTPILGEETADTITSQKAGIQDTKRENM